MANKAEFEGKTTRNGTWLEVWINDDYCAEVESVKIEVNITYTDVNKARSLMADKKMTKLDGKVTIKTHKTRDSLQHYIMEEVKKGKVPILSVVGKVDDPDSDGIVDVACKKCYPNKATLLDAEVGKLAEELIECDMGELPDFIDYVA